MLDGLQLFGVRGVAFDGGCTFVTVPVVGVVCCRSTRLRVRLVGSTSSFTACGPGYSLCFSMLKLATVGATHCLQLLHQGCSAVASLLDSSLAAEDTPAAQLSSTGFDAAVPELYR